MHDQICNAWITLIDGLAAEKQEIAAYARLDLSDGNAADSAVFDGMRAVLHWQGVQLGSGDLRYVYEEASAEFLAGMSNDMCLIPCSCTDITIAARKQRTPYVEITSYAPEVNDTYTALDSSLVQPVAQVRHNVSACGTMGLTQLRTDEGVLVQPERLAISIQQSYSKTRCRAA